jgi:phosphoribosylformimino-5-aminoimidazole carboxamide ribotide isomerase
MIFEVIPSIDLLDGNVVRLQRGSFDDVTVYSDNPLDTAKRWEIEGASRLHVVDLDGAKTGSPKQRDVIESIVAETTMPVQVAGGIRTIDDAVAYAGQGADRVVIGTIDDELLSAAVDALGSRLVVAVDARDGIVRVSGWQEATGENVIDACRRFAAAGVVRLLVTDIGRDGVLQGPNVDLYRQIVEAAQVPVLASGGVSSVDDLKALAAVEGVEGAIVGKALYTGAVELGMALRAFVA